MSFKDTSYGLFQGKIYGALRFLNGPQRGGFIHLGDADKMEISMKQKFDDVIESESGFGTNAAHIPTETSMDVKLNLLKIQFSNWELALWGTYGGTVDAGTVSGEVVKIFPGPSYVPFQHPGVSAVTLSLGVADVDYVVDPVNGGANILADSAVFTDQAGVSVTVGYDYAGYGGRVQAFTSQQPIMMLRLNGKNVANPGQPVITNVFQWAPDMAKMLSLIEKKRNAFELDGMLLIDDLRPAPTEESPMSQFFETIKG
jgi:hypothetical protein